MSTRPKPVIGLSTLDRWLEITGYGMLLLMWAGTIFAFLELPATVPIHYNLDGKADGYGSKIFLLLLPAIPTIIFFGITILARYPHIFNYMVTITEENAVKQYTIAVRLLRFLKISVVLIFLVDVLSTYILTSDITHGPGACDILVTFILLLAPTVFYIFKSFKSK